MNVDRCKQCVYYQHMRQCSLNARTSDLCQAVGEEGGRCCCCSGPTHVMSPWGVVGTTGQTDRQTDRLSAHVMPWYQSHIHTSRKRAFSPSPRLHGSDSHLSSQPLCCSDQAAQQARKSEAVNSQHVLHTNSCLIVTVLQKSMNPVLTVCLMDGCAAAELLK